MMHVAEVVAQGYRYPTETAAEALGAAIEAGAHGAVEKHMGKFLKEVNKLSLGQWEELHTSTLDLSPQFIPYVGHVVWGENYRRGEFMADLKGAMRGVGVDLGGELPDHIEPILRYLAASSEPLTDLTEALPGAVATMRETLATASRKNPYRHLLAATEVLTADLAPVTITGRGAK